MDYPIFPVVGAGGSETKWISTGGSEAIVVDSISTGGSEVIVVDSDTEIESELEPGSPISLPLRVIRGSQRDSWLYGYMTQRLKLCERFPWYFQTLRDQGHKSSLPDQGRLTTLIGAIEAKDAIDGGWYEELES